jgi:midasin
MILDKETGETEEGAEKLDDQIWGSDEGAEKLVDQIWGSDEEFEEQEYDKNEETGKSNEFSKALRNFHSFVPFSQVKDPVRKMINTMI